MPGLTARRSALHAARATALAFALGAAAVPGHAQNFVYVEAGLAGCPAAPAAAVAAPKDVPRGTALAGRMQVSCGFGEGSYTVSLNATDPDARFAPKTFIVNFGRIVGNGSFTVSFANPGVHTVSATITSNMGSPAVKGRFVSSTTAFKVAAD